MVERSEGGLTPRDPRAGRPAGDKPESQQQQQDSGQGPLQQGAPAQRPPQQPQQGAPPQQVNPAPQQQAQPGAPPPQQVNPAPQQQAQPGAPPGRAPVMAGQQAGGPPAEPPRGFLPPPPTPDQVPDRPAGGMSRLVKKLDPIIERTKIDFDACRQVVSRAVSDKEVKVKEEILAKAAERSSEPAKPAQPVEKYRVCTPCGSIWERMSGADKFKVCSLCNCHVYDFTGMDKQQAEALVFQREGKEKPSFYRRKDGRFMTSDCPVGVRRGRNTLISIVAGVLIFSGAVALAFMMPKPPKPAVTEAPKEEPKPTKVKVTDTKVAPPVIDANMPPPFPTDANPYASMPVEGQPGVPGATPGAIPAPEGSSPTGRYVTVPVEVLEQAGMNQNAAANQPPAGGQAAPAPGGPAGTAAVTPAASPVASPAQQAQAPAALPQTAPADGPPAAQPADSSPQSGGQSGVQTYSWK